jgi:arylsulfatase A-like enzyme
VTTDFVPTALAAVGITPSDKKPLDGHNLLPYFRGEEKRRPKSIGFHSCGWEAWTTHQYKIVKGGKEKQGGGTKGEWELYDLEKDPIEERNIAKQNPEVLQRLIKEWETWAASAEKDCAATAAKYPNLRFNQQKAERSK